MREYEDEEPYVIIEKHSGSVGSLLLGVAIGAGLALLFAPQSGPETRRGISRQARPPGWWPSRSRSARPPRRSFGSPESWRPTSSS